MPTGKRTAITVKRVNLIFTILNMVNKKTEVLTEAVNKVNEHKQSLFVRLSLIEQRNEHEHGK